MAEVTVKGLHRIEIRNKDGKPEKIALEIRFKTIRVLPPIGKQKRFPALVLTVIQGVERGMPREDRMEADN
jgi:hypothetical protein